MPKKGTTKRLPVSFVLVSPAAHSDKGAPLYVVTDSPGKAAKKFYRKVYKTDLGPHNIVLRREKTGKEYTYSVVRKRISKAVVIDGVTTKIKHKLEARRIGVSKPKKKTKTSGEKKTKKPKTKKVKKSKSKSTGAKKTKPKTKKVKKSKKGKGKKKKRSTPVSHSFGMLF